MLVLSFVSFGCLKEPTREIAQGPDPFLWDFGRVKAGKILYHTFVLKNDTKGRLIVKNISTSCGCTVSKINKKAIEPKESSLIKVKFKTKGYLGVTKQRVYVQTNNFDNPVVVFTVQADIFK